MIALVYVDDRGDAGGIDDVVAAWREVCGTASVRAWRTTPFVLAPQTDPASGRWQEPEGEPGGLVVCAPPLEAGDAVAWPPAAGTGPCDWAGVRIAGTPGLTGKGDGLLTVTMRPVPGAEEEFNAWYDTEHLPPLFEVPGVLSATRFRAEQGAPAYFAVYELEDPDVGRSQAWQDAGKPTPWTRRMRGLTTDRRARLWAAAG